MCVYFWTACLHVCANVYVNMLACFNMHACFNMQHRVILVMFPQFRTCTLTNTTTEKQGELEGVTVARGTRVQEQWTAPLLGLFLASQ